MRACLTCKPLRIPNHFEQARDSVRINVCHTKRTAVSCHIMHYKVDLQNHKVDVLAAIKKT